MKQKLMLTGALLTLFILPLLSHWLKAQSSVAIANEPTMSAVAVGQSLGSPTVDSPSESERRLSYASGYLGVIQKTISMVHSRTARQRAHRFGLDITDVTWEDTGRFKDSAVGPNISDMTIQVQHKNPDDRYSLHMMPVIRFPNFADKTADIPLEQMYVNVGNEKNQSLRKVPLKKVLQNLRKYLSKPNSWKGREKSMLAKRDSHVLVSAQAAFLPIPKNGIAQFNPVLFNYQSYEGDPAVLTLLATREGTSVTVIDNKRDGFDAGQTWGQRLFFNKNGERASFTGQRLSDFNVDDGERDRSLNSASKSDEGLNMVMLIQVPLKQKARALGNSELAQESMASSSTVYALSDVEAAVIGHGAVEGPFTEIDNLKIERDERFPIRVTVQFYKGTSNGVVSDANMQQIYDQIEQVYSDADYIGSLVTEGETRRPTEYDGPKHQPPGWWNDFWRRHEANTGQSREKAIQMLRRLRGKKWYPLTEDELRREISR
ncbi:MAG: hypothetical protein AAGB01_07620, partial [Cyanobacteria bacterium P01_F01_bin.42]